MKKFDLDEERYKRIIEHPFDFELTKKDYISISKLYEAESAQK